MPYELTWWGSLAWALGQVPSRPSAWTALQWPQAQHSFGTQSFEPALQYTNRCVMMLCIRQLTVPPHIRDCRGSFGNPSSATRRQEIAA